MPTNEIPSVAQRMNGMGAAKGTGMTKSSIKQNLFNKPRQQGQARSQQKANPIPYKVPGQAARPEIGTAPVSPLVNQPNQFVNYNAPSRNDLVTGGRSEYASDTAFRGTNAAPAPVPMPQKASPTPPSEPMSGAAYAAKFYTPFTPEQAAKNEKDAALYKSDYSQWLANWKVDQANNNKNYQPPSNQTSTSYRPTVNNPQNNTYSQVQVAPPENVGAKMNADGFTYNDPKTGRLIYTRPPVWNPETDGQEGVERTHRAKGGQFAMGLDGKMIPVLGPHPGAKK